MKTLKSFAKATSKNLIFMKIFKLGKTMKKFVLISLVFTSSFSYAQSDKIIGQLDKIVDMEQKAHSYIGQNLASTVPDNYDLKYHRFDWIIDPGVYFIWGSVTSYFVPTVAGFSQIDFDLATALTVDSVIYHDTLITFSHVAGNTLQIMLPSVVPAGTLDSVQVFYQGMPLTTGFGSFNQTTHNGVPIIWTLSEPYGAKDWWPCKQSLSDKIDSIDVIVTTPQAYRAASNGVLISETLNGSYKIYHWQSHYPIAAYLIAIGVTNYYVYSDYLQLSNGDTLEILNYVYPEDSASAMAQTPALLDVISLFDSLTILYPFANEKYGHCQFGWGGGMEHQTMSFVVYYQLDLLAHELAHQWFGDMVTCGSFEDIWLNEGFATYMEALSKQFLYPADWQPWKSGRINQITSQPGGSVLCDDTTSVSRIFSGRLSYSKGAYLLHMLRWQLGDSLFFQSLRNYLNDPVLAYNYAKTTDLKQHLETTSGQNLTTFFDQWYYNQGYPSYQVEWNQIGSDVFVKINQSQSHASVSFFEMPVPIRFQAGATDTTLVFNHTFSGEIFTASISFTATTVTFDPELWILSANNSVTHNLALSIAKDENSFIHVYPNPAVNGIIIECDKNADQLSEVDLMDVLGNLVIREKLAQPGSHMEINLSGISSGVYFIRAKTEHGVFEKRFVKM